jgi:hypothetical protein
MRACFADCLPVPSVLQFDTETTEKVDCYAVAASQVRINADQSEHYPKWQTIVGRFRPRLRHHLIRPLTQCRFRVPLGKSLQNTRHPDEPLRRAISVIAQISDAEVLSLQADIASRILEKRPATQPAPSNSGHWLSKKG